MPVHTFLHIQTLGTSAVNPAFRYARRAGAWLGSAPVETVATFIPASRIWSRTASSGRARRKRTSGSAYSPVKVSGQGADSSEVWAGIVVAGNSA
jgi:hypothetical protein